MKKVLLILVLLALSNIPVSAQTIYWTEDFNSNSNWTLEQNWSITGGKLEFYWAPVFTNFDLSAVSSPIALHPSTQNLIVKQHLSTFNASTPPEVAEIYLVTSTAEHLLWSHTLNLGSWGSESGTEIEFNISEFAGQNVQIKFRTHGLTTFNFNWWHVFELKLTAILENDLAALEISGPNPVIASQTGTWNVQVKNTGILPQQGFSVSFYSMRFGNLLGTISISETIQPQQIITVNFDWTPAFVHNTVLYARVNMPGDEFTGNNTSKNQFVRVKPDYNISILVWDNDNGINTVVCPEEGDLIRPTDALVRTLDKAGITYQIVNELPASLSGYDIVFVSMGSYCLS
jgi:hypothetical protein